MGSIAIAFLSGRSILRTIASARAAFVIIRWREPARLVVIGPGAPRRAYCFQAGSMAAG